MLHQRYFYLLLYFVLLDSFVTASCFVITSQSERRCLGSIHRWGPLIGRSSCLQKDPFRYVASEELILRGLTLDGNKLHTQNNTEIPDLTDIVVHKVKETVSHTGAIKTLHVIIERFIEQMERISERTLERVSERSFQRAAKRNWERLGERALKRARANTFWSRVGERTLWEQIGEHSSQRALERVNERALERFSERAVERMGERAVERMGERVLERVGERSVERASERALIHMGEKAMLKNYPKLGVSIWTHSANRMATSIHRLERMLKGISLGRLALRFGLGLTIVLPIFGGFFALYLFHGDVLRWQDERQKQQSFIDMNHTSTIHLKERRYWNSAAAAVAFLFGAGVIDFLDAILHFWMAFTIFVAHHHHSGSDWMEKTSILCALLSTVFAICGEIFSHRTNADRRNAASSALLIVEPSLK